MFGFRPPELRLPDQLYQFQPVDMTAHLSTSRIVPNPLQSSMYHQIQPSTSGAMRLNESAPSSESMPFTANENQTAKCHSSTETTSTHPSSHFYPPNVDPNNANLHQYFYPHTINQSSALSSNYYSWMNNGSSTMMMATNNLNAPSQQNVNYQENLYLQQPQHQPTRNVNSPFFIWNGTIENIIVRVLLHICLYVRKTSGLRRMHQVARSSLLDKFDARIQK